MSKQSVAGNHIGINNLVAFWQRHKRIFVLTGAGLSTESGIPDYRDAKGEWKRKAPIQHQAFIDDPAVRQRYWARSLLGWRHFGSARAGRGHQALAQLENTGRIETIVTQNVDGLHQQAGSEAVIDLHGRISELHCLQCGWQGSRRDYQEPLAASNPRYLALSATIAPDGDADLEQDDFSDFVVPPCPNCGGVIMPQVVFFGGTVPRSRVDRAFAHLAESDAVLVVGSSLMVFSGFRFCRQAHEQGIPIAAINIGVTRADELLSFKLEQPCGDALAALAECVLA